MKEEDKEKEYINYMIIKHRQAEEIAINDIGASDNSTINAIFDKITEPYGYWKKRFKY